MRDYKKLDVWKKAHLLTKQVYKEIVPLMPPEKKIALTSQLRRSAYSIPLNIVEGCGRNTDKDFAHFLDISLGSIQELEYCLLLARDLTFIGPDTHGILDEKVNEIKAMIINLIKRIRS